MYGSILASNNSKSKSLRVIDGIFGLGLPLDGANMYFVFFIVSSFLKINFKN